MKALFGRYENRRERRRARRGWQMRRCCDHRNLLDSAWERSAGHTHGMEDARARPSMNRTLLFHLNFAFDVQILTSSTESKINQPLEIRQI